jgi:hypothetical protein
MGKFTNRKLFAEAVSSDLGGWMSKMEGAANQPTIDLMEQEAYGLKTNEDKLKELEKLKESVLRVGDKTLSDSVDATIAKLKAGKP